MASGTVLYEPDSGVLVAGERRQALHHDGGFELRTGCKVVSLRQSADAATVEMADGSTLQADVVVDCAGPAALELLGTPSATTCSPPPPLPQVAVLSPPHGSAVLPPPASIEWGDDMVYGLPVPDGGPHTGTYKVAHHTPGPALDSFDPTDPAPLAGDDPAHLALLTAAVARLLPTLHPQPLATERCVYDNSPDADFVLDRVGHVVVGCGTSGHAFKFGPLFGDILADLAEGMDLPVDLARFGLGRGPPAAEGPRPPPGRFRRCPVSSPCCAVSTSPVTAASPWATFGLR